MCYVRYCDVCCDVPISDGVFLLYIDCVVLFVVIYYAVYVMCCLPRYTVNVQQKYAV